MGTAREVRSRFVYCNIFSDPSQETTYVYSSNLKRLGDNHSLGGGGRSVALASLVAGKTQDNSAGTGNTRCLNCPAKFLHIQCDFTLCCRLHQHHAPTNRR